MKNNKIKFVIDLLLPVVVGGFIGFLLRDDLDYVDTLNRKIKLPSIVFPIVWTFLYLLMGLWHYIDSKEDNNSLLYKVYYVSLIFNILYMPIFFTFHLVILAIVDIVILFVLVSFMFYETYKKKYGYLLSPYIIWLLIALVLMMDIAVNN